MKYRKILSVTFLIFSISFWGIAEDNDSNQDIKTELYGIDSLELVIENLDKDAKALGLNEEKIKTKTELKLRREGIEILEKYQSPPKIGTKEWKDWKDQIHQPYIYININIVGKNNPAFNVLVEIKEWVKIERNSVETVAATWSHSITGFTYESEDVISCLSRLIDEFLNEWYEANPKKK